jgi:hypothetical protein
MTNREAHRHEVLQVTAGRYLAIKGRGTGAGCRCNLGIVVGTLGE